MEQLKRFGPIVALSQFWSGLSSPQRATLAAFVSLTAVLLIVISVIASRPTMAVLFSGLAQEDAAAIAQRLRDQKVPYEIADGGSVIKVPAKQLYDLRLQMAGAGLPAGGNVGFEIFDKSALGMTQFAQKMNYQRALQGELSRTICELSPVLESRVHLAIPEERLFAENQEKPSASVVIKLRRGIALDDNQVAGIVHLVASSVPGLQADNVAVVDSLGNVLYDGSGGSGAMAARLTSRQADAKRAFEKQVQTSVQTMLDKVIGQGKAVVRVNATLNFDRKEATNELYEPIAQDKGVVTSEQILSESYNATGGGAGAPVGVAANIRGAAAPTVRKGPGDSYTRTDTTTQYEVGRKVEQVSAAPGRIEKLNVAVLLDAGVPAAQMTSIKQAVEAAAGVDITRGDKLVVESTPFDTKSAEKEEKEMTAAAAKANYLNIGKNVGAGLLLLGLLFFLKSLFKQVKFTLPELRSNEAASPRSGSEGGPQVVVRERRSPQIEIGPPQIDENELYAQEVTKRQPEEVAQMVRTWMSE